MIEKETWYSRIATLYNTQGAGMLHRRNKRWGLVKAFLEIQEGAGLQVNQLAHGAALAFLIRRRVCLYRSMKDKRVECFLEG